MEQRWLESVTEAERTNADRFYEDLQGGLGSPALARGPESHGEDGTTPGLGDMSIVIGDPLLDSCTAAIVDLVDRSPLVRYRWPNRGRAPIGYLKGMALTYARVYCKWKAGDTYALQMAKRPGASSVDALAQCAATFRAASLSNASDGVDTLRHVFVFLVGLGMRESAGRYSEGRDMSANNVSPTTAEAGLFQMSYSVGVGSTRVAGGWLRRQYNVLKARPYSGLLSVFREGVRARAGQLTGFGSTNGGKFREFCVLEPALCAEVAALGIRKRRRHWGPINRCNVTVNPDCDRLFAAVQQAVDEAECCRPPTVLPAPRLLWF